MPTFIYGDQESPANPSSWDYGPLTFPEGAVPSIGSLTGLVAPAQTITFTKSDMSGILTVTLGGFTLALVSDIANVVTCLIPDNITIPWGTEDLVLVATDDNTDTASIVGLTLSPRVAWTFSNFTGPVPDYGTTESFHELVFIDAAFTGEVGDQLRYTENTGLTVDGSWLPTIDPPIDVFGTYEVLDVSVSSFIGPLGYAIEQPDGVPDAFNFFDYYTEALPTVITVYETNLITMSGINIPADLVISGGDGTAEYSKNGGAYTNVADTVEDGDTLRLRVTANIGQVVASSSITIGGVLDFWTVIVGDIFPDQFTFTDVVDAGLNSVVTSNIITPVGYDSAPAYVSIVGGEYNVNSSGIWLSVPTTIIPGDTIQVRGNASPLFLTTVDVDFSIGYNPETSLGDTNTTDTFSITTVIQVTTPDPFVFIDVEDAALSTLYTSNAQTITGINAPAGISITDGEYSIDSGAFTSVPGTIQNGSSVVVRTTSSASFETTISVVLDIGGIVGTYNVTTLVDADQVPDPFSFTPAVGVDLSTLTTSETIVITGLTTASAVSVVGGQYSVNGGIFTSDIGEVENNGTVAIRGTSSSEIATETIVLLTIGGVEGTFSITTLVTDSTPDDFPFTPVVDSETLTLQTSNTVTITGINVEVDVTVVGGSWSKNGGPFVTTPGTLLVNDTVAVNVTSSPDLNTEVSSTLIVGGVSSSFLVTTKGLDSEFFYNLLGITSDNIPSDVIDGFIAAWEEVYGSNNCQVMYHTIISIYTWLIQNANATAINGSRREKKDKREIEVRDSNTASNWQGALDNFTKSPWNLLPLCSTEFSTNLGSRILIGGTKKDVINSVRDNTNSYNQYDERSPYSPSTPGRNVRRGGFKLY